MKKEGVWRKVMGEERSNRDHHCDIFNFRGLGVPEWALCGIPLRFRIGVKVNPSELPCTCN